VSVVAQAVQMFWEPMPVFHSSPRLSTAAAALTTQLTLLLLHLLPSQIAPACSVAAAGPAQTKNAMLLL
jgi:hypothetical protein